MFLLLSRLFRSLLTTEEEALVARLRTPHDVQKWVSALDYNYAPDTVRSFRGVLEHKEAHCLEGALSAAFLLEHHGHPPILLDLESADRLDHVLLLFQENGMWGAVGKSRYPGLKGRKPAFRTIRHLAWSYVDPFVDKTGRLTGFAVYDLRDHEGGPDWRWDTRNVWRIERALIDTPHTPLKASETRHEFWKRKYFAFKEAHPGEEPPPEFYPHHERMMR